MTVSADSVREFTRREILRRALQTARLLNAHQNPSDTDPRVTQAADALEMSLGALQAEGILDETGELKTLSLTAGTLPTTDITLPSDTNDVRGTAMLLTSSTSDGEIPVLPMGHDEWLQITDKTMLGTPSRYYVHRLLSVTLRLWPGVDSAASGWSLRYRQIRLLKGTGTGGSTMDLRRHWTKYLVYATAFELAVSNHQDVAFCGFLRSERDRLLGKSLAHARPKGPIQIHSTHRGPWR